MTPRDATAPAAGPRPAPPRRESQSLDRKDGQDAWHEIEDEAAREGEEEGQGQASHSTLARIDIAPWSAIDFGARMRKRSASLPA